MTTQETNRPFRALNVALSGLAVMCLLASGTTQAADGKKVLLRYKFQPGQIVRYDVTLNDDYVVQVGEDEDTPYSHQTSTKNYTVKSVNPDGSAVLQLMIEEVNLEIHQNGETFKYNSRDDDKPLDQPVFQAMGSLVGRPHLQLTITPRGEVSEFLPLVRDEQVPDNPSQVAFDVLQRLPEEPVAIGDTWREDFEVKLAPTPDAPIRQPVRVQRRYTLKNLEGSLATIDLETKILSIINSPDDEVQLIRRQPSGTIVIDLDRGLLISKHFTQNEEVTGFGMGASLMRFTQLHKEKLREVKTATSTTNDEPAK